MRFALILIVAFSIVACRQPAVEVDDGHSHEDSHSTTITKWSENLELFVEFAPIIKGQETEFIIHLTKLSDFKPVTSGSVELDLQPHGGEPQVFKAEEMSRPGIFQPAIKMDNAGEYDCVIRFSGENLEDEFDIGHVEVFESLADMEEQEHDDSHAGHSHGEAAHDEESGDITFLKEQQWKTGFATAHGRFMKVKSSITAIAEVIPHQHGYAEVVAPVDGYLKVEHNETMVIPGTTIKKGDLLATVCPHVGRANTWTERKLSFEQAIKNFERAENLLQRNAISQKEYEEIRQQYMIEKTGYETLLGANGNRSGTAGDGCNHFELTAPISGIVAAVDVLPGQTINAGQKLLTIVDPSIVWLRADVYEKDYYKLGRPDGATLFIPGLDEHLHLAGDEMVLLNKSDLVDRENRTIPVLFEIQNRGRLLKIGQVIQAEIYTSEQQESWCVPEDAILDEDFQKVIFVQHGGESFEKRVITPGPHFNGWVAIKEGLEPHERIVTKGAYQIRLASVTTQVGHAHVH